MSLLSVFVCHILALTATTSTSDGLEDDSQKVDLEEVEQVESGEVGEVVLDEYEENIRYMISLQRTLCEDILEQQRVFRETAVEEEDFLAQQMQQQPSCSYDHIPTSSSDTLAASTSSLQEHAEVLQQPLQIAIEDESEQVSHEIQIKVSSDQERPQELTLTSSDEKESAPKKFKTAQDELESLRYIGSPQIIVNDDYDEQTFVDDGLNDLMSNKKDDFDPLECLNYNVDFIRTNSTSSSRSGGPNDRSETSYLSDMWNSLLERVEDVQSRLRRHSWHQAPEVDQLKAPEDTADDVKKSKQRPKSVIDSDEFVFHDTHLGVADEHDASSSNDTIFNMEDTGTCEDDATVFSVHSQNEEDIGVTLSDEQEPGKKDVVETATKQEDKEASFTMDEEECIEGGVMSITEKVEEIGDVSRVATTTLEAHLHRDESFEVVKLLHADVTCEEFESETHPQVEDRTERETVSESVTKDTSSLFSKAKVVKSSQIHQGTDSKQTSIQSRNDSNEEAGLDFSVSAEQEEEKEEYRESDTHSLSVESDQWVEKRDEKDSSTLFVIDEAMEEDEHKPLLNMTEKTEEVEDDKSAAATTTTVEAHVGMDESCEMTKLSHGDVEAEEIDSDTHLHAKTLKTEAATDSLVKDDEQSGLQAEPIESLQILKREVETVNEEEAVEIETEMEEDISAELEIDVDEDELADVLVEEEENRVEEPLETCLTIEAPVEEVSQETSIVVTQKEEVENVSTASAILEAHVHSDENCEVTKMQHGDVECEEIESDVHVKAQNLSKKETLLTCVEIEQSADKSVAPAVASEPFEVFVGEESDVESRVFEATEEEVSVSKEDENVVSLTSEDIETAAASTKDTVVSIFTLEESVEESEHRPLLNMTEKTEEIEGDDNSAAATTTTVEAHVRDDESCEMTKLSHGDVEAEEIDSDTHLASKSFKTEAATDSVVCDDNQSGLKAEPLEALEVLKREVEVESEEKEVEMETELEEDHSTELQINVDEDVLADVLIEEEEKTLDEALETCLTIEAPVDEDNEETSIVITHKEEVENVSSVSATLEAHLQSDEHFEVTKMLHGDVETEEIESETHTNTEKLTEEEAAPGFTLNADNFDIKSVAILSQHVDVLLGEETAVTSKISSESQEAADGESCLQIESSMSEEDSVEEKERDAGVFTVDESVEESDLEPILNMTEKTEEEVEDDHSTAATTTTTVETHIQEDESTELTQLAHGDVEVEEVESDTHLTAENLEIVAASDSLVADDKESGLKAEPMEELHVVEKEVESKEIENSSFAVNTQIEQEDVEKELQINVLETHSQSEPSPVVTLLSDDEQGLSVYETSEQILEDVVALAQKEEFEIVELVGESVESATTSEDTFESTPLHVGDVECEEKVSEDLFLKTDEKDITAVESQSTTDSTDVESVVTEVQVDTTFDELSADTSLQPIATTFTETTSSIDTVDEKQTVAETLFMLQTSSQNTDTETKSEDNLTNFVLSSEVQTVESTDVTETEAKDHAVSVAETSISFEDQILVAEMDSESDNDLSVSLNIDESNDDAKRAELGDEQTVSQHNDASKTEQVEEIKATEKPTEDIEFLSIGDQATETTAVTSDAILEDVSEAAFDITEQVEETQATEKATEVLSVEAKSSDVEDNDVETIDVVMDIKSEPVTTENNGDEIDMDVSIEENVDFHEAASDDHVIDTKTDNEDLESAKTNEVINVKEVSEEVEIVAEATEAKLEDDIEVSSVGDQATVTIDETLEDVTESSFDITEQVEETKATEKATEILSVEVQSSDAEDNDVETSDVVKDIKSALVTTENRKDEIELDVSSEENVDSPEVASDDHVIATKTDNEDLESAKTIEVINVKVVSEEVEIVAEATEAKLEDDIEVSSVGDQATVTLDETLEDVTESSFDITEQVEETKVTEKATEILSVEVQSSDTEDNDVETSDVVKDIKTEPVTTENSEDEIEVDVSIEENVDSHEGASDDHVIATKTDNEDLESAKTNEVINVKEVSEEVEIVAEATEGKLEEEIEVSSVGDQATETTTVTIDETLEDVTESSFDITEQVEETKATEKATEVLSVEAQSSDAEDNDVETSDVVKDIKTEPVTTENSEDEFEVDVSIEENVDSHEAASDDHVIATKTDNEDLESAKTNEVTNVKEVSEEVEIVAEATEGKPEEDIEVSSVGDQATETTTVTIDETLEDVTESSFDLTEQVQDTKATEKATEVLSVEAQSSDVEDNDVETSDVVKEIKTEPVTTEDSEDEIELDLSSEENVDSPEAASDDHVIATKTDNEDLESAKTNEVINVKEVSEEVEIVAEATEGKLEEDIEVSSVGDQATETTTVTIDETLEDVTESSFDITEHVEESKATEKATEVLSVEAQSSDSEDNDVETSDVVKEIKTEPVTTENSEDEIEVDVSIEENVDSHEAASDDHVIATKTDNEDLESAKTNEVINVKEVSEEVEIVAEATEAKLEDDIEVSSVGDQATVTIDETLEDVTESSFDLTEQVEETKATEKDTKVLSVEAQSSDVEDNDVETSDVVKDIKTEPVITEDSEDEIELDLSSEENVDSPEAASDDHVIATKTDNEDLESAKTNEVIKIKEVSEEVEIVAEATEAKLEDDIEVSSVGDQATVTIDETLEDVTESSFDITEQVEETKATEKDTKVLSVEAQSSDVEDNDVETSDVVKDIKTEPVITEDSEDEIELDLSSEENVDSPEAASDDHVIATKTDNEDLESAKTNEVIKIKEVSEEVEIVAEATEAKLENDIEVSSVGDQATVTIDETLEDVTESSFDITEQIEETKATEKATEVLSVEAQSSDAEDKDVETGDVVKDIKTEPVTTDDSEDEIELDVSSEENVDSPEAASDDHVIATKTDNEDLYSAKTNEVINVKEVSEEVEIVAEATEGKLEEDIKVLSVGDQATETTTVTLEETLEAVTESSFDITEQVEEIKATEKATEVLSVVAQSSDADDNDVETSDVVKDIKTEPGTTENSEDEIEVDVSIEENVDSHEAVSDDHVIATKTDNEDLESSKTNEVINVKEVSEEVEIVAEATEGKLEEDIEVSSVVDQATENTTVTIDETLEDVTESSFDFTEQIEETKSTEKDTEVLSVEAQSSDVEDKGVETGDVVKDIKTEPVTTDDSEDEIELDVSSEENVDSPKAASDDHVIATKTDNEDLDSAKTNEVINVKEVSEEVEIVAEATEGKLEEDIKLSFVGDQATETTTVTIDETLEDVTESSFDITEQVEETKATEKATEVLSVEAQSSDVEDNDVETMDVVKDIKTEPVTTENSDDEIEVDVQIEENVDSHEAASDDHLIATKTDNEDFESAKTNEVVNVKEVSEETEIVAEATEGKLEEDIEVPSVGDQATETTTVTIDETLEDVTESSFDITEQVEETKATEKATEVLSVEAQSSDVEDNDVETMDVVKDIKTEPGTTENSDDEIEVDVSIEENVDSHEAASDDHLIATKTDNEDFESAKTNEVINAKEVSEETEIVAEATEGKLEEDIEVPSVGDQATETTTVTIDETLEDVTESSFDITEQFEETKATEKATEVLSVEAQSSDVEDNDVETMDVVKDIKTEPLTTEDSVDEIELDVSSEENVDSSEAASDDHVIATKTDNEDLESAKFNEVINVKEVSEEVEIVAEATERKLEKDIEVSSVGAQATENTTVNLDETLEDVTEASFSITEQVEETKATEKPTEVLSFETQSSDIEDNDVETMDVVKDIKNEPLTTEDSVDEIELDVSSEENVDSPEAASDDHVIATKTDNEDLESAKTNEVINVKEVSEEVEIVAEATEGKLEEDIEVPSVKDQATETTTVTIDETLEDVTESSFDLTEQFEETKATEKDTEVLSVEAQSSDVEDNDVETIDVVKDIMGEPVTTENNNDEIEVDVSIEENVDSPEAPSDDNVIETKTNNEDLVSAKNNDVINVKELSEEGEIVAETTEGNLREVIEVSSVGDQATEPSAVTLDETLEDVKEVSFDLTEEVEENKATEMATEVLSVETQSRDVDDNEVETIDVVKDIMGEPVTAENNNDESEVDVSIEEIVDSPQAASVDDVIAMKTDNEDLESVKTKEVINVKEVSEEEIVAEATEGKLEEDIEVSSVGDQTTSVGDQTTKATTVTIDEILEDVTESSIDITKQVEEIEATGKPTEVLDVEMHSSDVEDNEEVQLIDVCEDIKSEPVSDGSTMEGNALDSSADDTIVSPEAESSDRVTLAKSDFESLDSERLEATCAAEVSEGNNKSEEVEPMVDEVITHGNTNEQEADIDSSANNSADGPQTAKEDYLESDEDLLWSNMKELQEKLTPESVDDCQLESVPCAEAKEPFDVINDLLDAPRSRRGKKDDSLSLFDMSLQDEDCDTSAPVLMATESTDFKSTDKLFVGLTEETLSIEPLSHPPSDDESAVEKAPNHNETPLMDDKKTPETVLTATEAPSVTSDASSPSDVSTSRQTSTTSSRETMDQDSIENLSGAEAMRKSALITTQLKDCCQIANDLTDDQILLDLLKFANDNNLTAEAKRMCRLILSLTYDVSTLSDVMGSDKFCFDAEEQEFLINYLNSIVSELAESVDSPEVQSLLKHYSEKEPENASKVETDIRSLIESVYNVLSSVEADFLQTSPPVPTTSGVNSLEKLIDLHEQMLDLSLSLTLLDTSDQQPVTDRRTVIEMQTELEEVLSQISKMVQEDSVENVLGLSFDLSAATSEPFVEPLKILTTRLKIRGRPRRPKKHVTFQSFEEYFPPTETEEEEESEEEDSFLRKYTSRICNTRLHTTTHAHAKHVHNN